MRSFGILPLPLCKLGVGALGMMCESCLCTVYYSTNKFFIQHTNQPQNESTAQRTTDLRYYFAFRINSDYYNYL